MAKLVIKTQNIISNISKISEFLGKHDIYWSLITKVFSGDKEFLKEILIDEVIENIHSIGDSRLTSLKNIKAVNPGLRTIYIKPPASVYAKEVVEFADVSLNSSLYTIKLLNKEAQKQNKIHRVIIMIELGELREGVLRENVLDFYRQIFNLPHIEVIGIGSNLGCMYGVEPSFDKLMQLVLYKQLIESQFDTKLPYVSGGSSITLPLVESGVVPKELNHFRIGESAFFGTSPLDNKKFSDLSTDTFDLEAWLLEMEEKIIVPDGNISEASIGHTSEQEQDVDRTVKANKGIFDFGILDVDIDNIKPTDENFEFVGTTSDMTVYKINNVKKPENKDKYKVGKSFIFKPNYMGVARLLNSKFIDKEFR